ncbi:MAG: tRNA1(Val) (adenine(37)-N6)-methyltransferase [Christensenellales bacterium]
MYYNLMKVIEDLQFKGLRIVVDKSGFSYGHDALLLADFVRMGPKDSALDLGAGTGILAILLNGRHGTPFTAVEIQPGAAALIEESIALNSQHDITPLCHDLRTLHEILPRESFTCAVCNPPYFSGGTPSQNEGVNISTHQESCTVEDVAVCARLMLKNGGRLWMCYPASGVAEAFSALRNNGMEPKRIRLVSGRNGPYLALMEAKKGGKTGLVWENTITNQQTGDTHGK